MADWLRFSFEYCGRVVIMISADNHSEWHGLSVGHFETHREGECLSRRDTLAAPLVDVTVGDFRDIGSSGHRFPNKVVRDDRLRGSVGDRGVEPHGSPRRQANAPAALQGLWLCYLKDQACWPGEPLANFHRRGRRVWGWATNADTSVVTIVGAAACRQYESCDGEP
jgi:hypothetical protein